MNNCNAHKFSKPVNCPKFNEQLKLVKCPKGSSEVRGAFSYDRSRRDTLDKYLVRFNDGHRAIMVYVRKDLIERMFSYNEAVPFHKDTKELRFEDFSYYDIVYSVALFARKHGWKSIKLESDRMFSPFSGSETPNNLIVTPKPFFIGEYQKVGSEQTSNAWWVGQAFLQYH